MSFGTNIECPARGCKGLVLADTYSLDPLVYMYTCPICERNGMWDKLVQLKNKVSRSFQGHKHSFPKSSSDEMLLAVKRARQMKEKTVDSELERVTFNECESF